jgi:hypothetical protein
MSHEILSAKFALLGFGSNLKEALSILESLIEKSKPLQDGATLIEFLAFVRDVQPELKRLSELYSKLMGSPLDEATVNVQLESLLEVNDGTFSRRPLVEALKFIAENWQLILSILAIL